jgi:hypothetical protein
MGPVLATGATLASAFEPQLVTLPTRAPKPPLQALSPPPPQATSKDESAKDKTTWVVILESICINLRFVKTHHFWKTII